MVSSDSDKCLYRKLKQKQKKIKHEYKTYYLTNEDFKNGSYIITKPGNYKLVEDIAFNPNSNDDHMPTADQEEYKSLGFSLGFFAAIVIQVDNVYINLNNHTIEQSKEHALQQRFFALIELASSPFIPPQGPSDFGSIITSKNVIIRNGTLGRSSHHGIHGNGAKNVLLENLTITDFEVAGVALNGSDNVVFNRMEIKNSKHVPVLATYSAARFARFFGKKLLSYNLSNDQKYQLTTAINKLENLMNITYQEVMNTGETNVELFRNESGLLDGNIYGLLLHTPGVAVNGFITSSDNTTKNVLINRVTLDNINCKVNEIIALSDINGNGAQVDVAGAVLQIDKICDNNGRYKGNELSDLQILLADIANQLGITLGKSNITSDVINWSKSNITTGDHSKNIGIKTLLNKGYKYKCNSDSMFHTNKGNNICRFDGVENMLVRKCTVKNIANYGRLGNDKLDGEYVKSHDFQTNEGYGGANTIGFSYSYCKNIKMYKNTIENLVSDNGSVFGVKIFNDSEVDIDNINIANLINNNKKGTDYYGNEVDFKVTLPNKIPNAVGIYSSSYSKIENTTIKGLKAPGCEVPIWLN